MPQLRRIVRAVVYAVYLLAVLEVGARILLSVDPLFERIRNRDNDSAARIAWVKRHGNRRDFTYTFDIFHPTRGWAVKPSLQEMNVFGGKILNSNSKGIRGKAEYEYARQPGKHRILVFGDSFTFGDEVSDDETYAHGLATLLPDAEVLNLGVHGYGHDQMLLYLNEEGVKYHPDVVVLGFVWLDMYRNLLAFNDYAKPRFELCRDGLHLTHSPVPPPEVVLDQEPYRSKALDLWVILRQRLRSRLGLKRKSAEKLTTAILDDFAATTRRIGAVPVFVYLPVADELSNPDAAMTPNEEFLNHVCRDHGVACLFLRPRFQEEEKKGLKFNARSHWLAREHLAAAEGIRDFLRGNGIL